MEEDIVLVIDGELPSMNEIVNSNRLNRFAGATQKRKYTELVAWACKSQNLKPIDYKVDVEINWYCKNKRKDKDNISAGIKFIFDGLMLAEVLKNDGWKEIGNIKHNFYVDKNNPRVVVVIKAA